MTETKEKFYKLFNSLPENTQTTERERYLKEFHKIADTYEKPSDNEFAFMLRGDRLNIEERKKRQKELDNWDEIFMNEILDKYAK